MKAAVKTTVGVLAAEAVESCLRKAEKYEKPVMDNTDPENLHQMRVQLRRLRTAMQVFEPSLRLPKGGREAQVAKVARCLGQQRDLDVIQATLYDQYAPDLPDTERATLHKVLKYLAKQQKKAQKRVKRELKGDRYTKLKTRLHKWALSPDCNATARLGIEAVLPDLMLPLTSRLWLHPGWLIGTHVTKGVFQPDTRLGADEVDTLVAESSHTLHSLRKQAKRVRYQLKFVSAHYGDRLDAELARFSDLQDVLGALQDSLVLDDFLTAALPNWSAKMPTLKALLMDSRHRAWKQWQTHQQFYLDTQNREALRECLMHPGTEPTSGNSASSSTKSKRSSSKSSAAGTKKATSSTSRRKKSSSSPRSSTAKKKSQSSDGSTAKDSDSGS